MPFTWAQIGMPGAGPGGIAFYGPYVVVDGPEETSHLTPRRTWSAPYAWSSSSRARDK